MRVFELKGVEYTKRSHKKYAQVSIMTITDGKAGVEASSKNGKAHISSLYVNLWENYL